MTTNREDTTMTTRRTPTQMAQDALDTAQRKVERAEARVERARAEQGDAFAARLDEIKARAEAATKGPWVRDMHSPDMSGRSGWYIRGPRKLGLRSMVLNSRMLPGDAEFIEHAREDVPWLIERIGELNGAMAEERAYRARLIGALKACWKVDMRKAREAQAELDHIRSELDVQRYHAEHDPCDVCSHLEAVELGELIDRLTLDVLGRTAERDRARSVAVALECEGEDECAGAAEDGEPR